MTAETLIPTNFLPICRRKSAQKNCGSGGRPQPKTDATKKIASSIGLLLNTYKDPRVTLSLEHNNLVVLFLNHAICAKDGKGVSIRTNYDKPKIDVSYSVYLYVEEWNG
mgnify:CR=1 FL=1